MGAEVLSAGKDAESKEGASSVAPPDLKEMFSLGPKNPLSGFPTREFPTQPAQFASVYEAYYDALAQLAEQVLSAMTIAIHLPRDHFSQYLDRHASALRALNYPSLEGTNVKTGQLRASAHTDYGAITILRSGGPGLQVSKDKDVPSWVDVPSVDDSAFVVNLGDLMKRWTNDKYLSTLHRVLPCNERRQSMAFFYNVNRDAVISNIYKESTHPEDEHHKVSKHEDIVAGDFLMQKHLAAQGLSPEKK
jgi:isopenicillin N synthase-like dioxygenase